MEKKTSIIKKGLHIFASFLLGATLLSGTSEVQAQDNAPNIVRYEGYSRDNVAENVAKKHFSDSKKVILVNREKFPDAISATNISQGQYPVLYTHANHLTEGTMELIQSMSLDEIYVLGGKLSVSESVISELEKATNAKVSRIAGKSRYDANVNAVKENFNQKDHVVIASGEVYSDALYGVSYANTIDAPVVLVKTNKLESSTIKLLEDLDVNQATIIGGTLTVTEAVEKQLNDMNISHERIAGRNRYIGSAEVANVSYKSPNNVVIASGEVFADALVSAPLAQKLNAPILLVRKDRMENVVENYLTSNTIDIKNIYIQGGPLTIYPTIENRITELTTYLDNEEGSQVDGNVNEGETSEAPEDKEIDFSKVDTALFNQEMLKYVNRERASVGVDALSYNNRLQRGTSIRADEILSEDSLSVGGVGHVRPDGTSFRTAFEYLGNDGELFLGENLAQNWIDIEGLENVEAGKTTIEKVLAKQFFNQYFRSQGHYENMINEDYVGFATDVRVAENGKIFNVQIFTLPYN